MAQVLVVHSTRFVAKVSRNMAGQTHIPSPAEIAARVKAREEIAESPAIKSMEEKISEIRKEVSKPKKKRTAAELRAAMDLLMEKHDFSPIEELIGIAIDLRDRPLMMNLRVSILQDLASYVQPKLKSVEMSGQVDHQHHIHIVRYGPDGAVTREQLPAPGSQASQLDNRETRPAGVLAAGPIVDAASGVVEEGAK